MSATPEQASLPGRRRLGRELAVILFLLVVAALLFGVPAQRRPQRDALEYREFSDAILDGTLFTLRGADVSRALATRTPGYPLCVSALRALGLGPEDAARALHVLLGLVTLVGVPLALRKTCPVWLSGAGVLLALAGMRRYYELPQTEWLTLILLLWLVPACARRVERPSLASLVAIGALASALVLTRPAMLPVLAFPFAFAAVRCGRSARLRGAVALASIAPVFLWMSFNAYRFGSFTLTPFAGPNLFAVAAIVGHATPREGDDQELVFFINAINKRKIPRPGVRLPPEAETVELYNKNFHDVAASYAERRAYDWMTFNRLLLGYSKRSLSANAGPYARYVGRNLKPLLADLAFVALPAVVLPIVWVRRGKQRGLALTSLAFTGLHAAHLALCASVEMVIPRYRWMTLSPLLGLALMTTGLFALEAWRRFRAARSGAA